MARKKRWEYGPLDEGVIELQLSSWKYFYDFVHQQILDYPGYIWRGHGSASWGLESTLERKLIGSIPKEEWSMQTSLHLNAFKMATRGRRGDNPPTLKDDNEWWALGQHHGLATPLLDWSASPFVALFFAFADQTPTPKGPRAVFAMHKAAAINAGIELVTPLMDENQRLVSQSGLFTRSPDDKTITEALQENNSKKNSFSLIKIVIPNRERIKCMKTLSRMNISHATLFPDLYGSSLHCNNKLDIAGY